MHSTNMASRTGAQAFWKTWSVWALWLSLVLLSISVVFLSYFDNGLGDYLFVLLPQIQFYLCCGLYVLCRKFLVPQRFVFEVQNFWQFFVCLFVFLLMECVYTGMTIRSSPLEQAISVHAIERLVYHLLLIAFVEEVIFREVPARLFGSTVGAYCIISSLIFSIYHIKLGLQYLPLFAAFGLLFAVLRIKGVSLFNLVILHFSFNYFNEIVFPVVGFRYGETEFVWIVPLSLLTIAAFAGVILTWRFGVERRDFNFPDASASSR